MARPNVRCSICGRDLGDLRTLEREVSEQALLMEDKTQNRLTQRGGVVLAAGTLRHQGEGHIRASRPILAVLELVERVASHEQDDRAVMSDAERKADRRRRDAVVIDRLAIHPQHVHFERGLWCSRAFCRAL